MLEYAKLILAVDSSQAKTATEDVKKLGQQGEATEKQLKTATGNIRQAFGGLFAGLSAGAFFGAIIQNTIESEHAISQLNAVLKSTGGIAGVTADEVLGLSKSLEAVTTFGDEAITNAQSLLLTFTNIGKDILPTATEAVLNMSVALGQDLKSSAIQLGKALNDPVQGITALKRVGVTFSDAQKDVIQSLIDTGRQAEAQQVILKELETEFGNSARAAANTFGGSLKQLKEAFGDLLEGSGGNLDEATSSVKDLTHTLQDPETQEAFAKLTAGALDFAGALAKVIAGAVGGAQAVGEMVAKFQLNTTTTQRLIGTLIPAYGAYTFFNNSQKTPASAFNSEAQRIVDGLDYLKPKPLAADNAGQAIPFRQGLNARSIINTDTDSGSKASKERLSDIDREILALSKQNALYGDLTKLQQVQIGLANKYYGVVTPAQSKHLQSLAAEYDKQKELNDKQKEAGDIFEETRTPLEKFNAEIARLNELRDTFVNGKPLIDPETYSRATQEAQDKLHGLKTSFGDDTDQMTEFAKAAAQNIQSAFADFLFDPFKNGLDGLLKNFVTFLAKAAAQAASAKILKSVFGGLASSDNGFLSALGAAFGGAVSGNADGGGLNRGMPYLVGERGPELFTPSSAGTVTPNGQFGNGGGTNNVTVNVSVEKGQQSSQGTSDKDARELGNRISAIVRAELIDQKRNGGLLA
jgi:hypothetical protein